MGKSKNRRMLFRGIRTEADAFLRQHSGRYYVYVLSRPDGRPFYVGKGQNRRVFEHELEALRAHPSGESNPFKCNVIRKILRDGGAVSYGIAGLFEPDAEAECLQLEASLIKEHGRLHEGGCLTNLAGGIGNLSGATPFSLARHADTLSGAPDDNPERAILNRFLLGIGPVASVPVKPKKQMSRILPTTPHPKPRSPTSRCAYALIASAVATGTQLTAEALLPRSFNYMGVEAIIENGVARDILKAGMAQLIGGRDASDEQFALTERQVDQLIALVGREALQRRGLL
jgi:hypothetical protein